MSDTIGICDFGMIGLCCHPAVIEHIVQSQDCRFTFRVHQLADHPFIGLLEKFIGLIIYGKIDNHKIRTIDQNILVHPCHSKIG